MTRSLSRPSVIFLFTILALLVVSVWGKRSIPAPHFDQNIMATQILWPRDAAAGGRVGALTFVEGWSLDSAYTGFGGFSGMALAGDREFLLVSDNGLVAGLALSDNGAVSKSFVRPLIDGPGKRGQKVSSDMEALAVSPDRSQFWIGFEHYHAVYRFGSNLFGPHGAKAQKWSRPPAMKSWWGNGGAEAIARLDDGCFLAIAEVEEKAPARKGLRGVSALLFNGDPTEQPDHVMPFRYDSEGKGRVTDAQQLPDGRLIILHRQMNFSEGFVSTLAIADLENIGPNDVMTSKTIARIARPSIADNFEGLAVVTEPAGRNDSKADDDWYVWLLSDDNLMGFERTYLIKYKIDRAQLR